MPHGISRKRFFCLVLIPVLALLLIPAAQAQTPPPAPAPPSVAPANSQDGEFIAFDLVVAGNVYGAVYGRFGDGWFEPANARDVIALLPAVRDPENFLPLFQGRIEKIRSIRDVGVLRVDSNNFKLVVDVDKAETILTAISPLEALKATDNNFAARNNLFAAGSSPTDDINLLEGMSLTHDTVFSKGSLSLQSSGTLTQEDDYVLRNARLNKDMELFGQDMTASAGLLETSNSMRFAKNVNYTGVRLSTNQTLLFRDKALQGSYIEIFLPQRAQVEVLRDKESSGQVLYSRILDFGTVQVDTRNFPQGSYDIVIVVKNGGTVLSRETRPFVKTQALPPRGKPVITLDAGEVRTNLDSEGVPLAGVNYRVRLLDSLGASLGVVATRRDHVAEAGLAVERGASLFKTMGLLQASLTGAVATLNEPAGLEASLRWTSPKASFGITAAKSYDRGTAETEIGGLAPSDRQSLNFNFSMPVNIGSYQVFSGFNAETSKSASQGRAWRYGPTLSHTFRPLGEYTPELKLEYTRSNTGNAALASFVLRTFNPVWQRTLNIDAAHTAENVNRTTSNMNIGYTGKGLEKDSWLRKITANLGLRLDPMSSSDDTRVAAIASSDVEYMGDLARVKAYLNQTVTQPTSGQLGGEVESTVVWTRAGGLKATGEGASRDLALVLITLHGTEKDEMDITVDGITRASGHAGQTVAIPITAYEQARIGAVSRRSRGTVMVREKAETVVGYPGSVIYRELNIVKSWVLTGALTDTEKAPLANVRFVMNGSVYYTDDTGFFTVETPVSAHEKIPVDTEAHTCTITIPELPAGDDILLDLGNIACAKKEQPRQ